MKTFIAIMLALTLLACDPEESSGGSSSEPKPPATLAQCLKQVLDGQTLSKGQTKDLPYSCSIAAELRGKKVTITDAQDSLNQDVLKLTPAEIIIPAQGTTLTGTFTLQGLKIGSVKGKIQVASYTEKFQITVQKSLAQYLKEVLNGKSIDRGQTKKFPYSHPISQDIQNKKLTITLNPQDSLEWTPAEIDIPAQGTLTGTFKVKGLKKVDKVKGSIKVASYTEDFSFTVTEPVIPKASQFTFTQIRPTLKKGSTTTANKFEFVYRKLAVHGDKLYSFENDKYFVSDDGITWTEKPKIQVGSSIVVTGRSSYLSFKGKLWGWGGKNILSYDDDNDQWTVRTTDLFGHNDGSTVIFQGKAYLLFGEISRSIHSSSDGIKWNKEYDYQPTGSSSDNFTGFDAVVHDKKIWIMGRLYTKVGQETAPTVFSYDGSNWKQEADLPPTQGRSWYGAESFAGGLFVIGGGYRDSKHDYVALPSLVYSPYGSIWHTIIPDTAKKSGAGNGIKTVFDMQKWTPKTGSHKDKEALWVINAEDGLVYRITYTEK